MIYKVAIIGYGYWGPKLARNIQNSNDFQIDYIVDTSKKNLINAKKSFPLSRFLNDYKKLDTSKIDLVVISTPTITHYKLAAHFLKYSNILIEKPLALNNHDVKKLERFSKKSKKKLFVDYPFIFSGSIKLY